MHASVKFKSMNLGTERVEIERGGREGRGRREERGRRGILQPVKGRAFQLSTCFVKFIV